MTSTAHQPRPGFARAPFRRASSVQPSRPPATLQHNLFFSLIVLILVGSLSSLDVRVDAFTTYLPTTLSYVAVGVVSFLGIYDTARERAFSLNISHWTYILFFLFYAPFIQFLVQESAPQSDLGLFDQYAIWVNCITLVWCGLYYYFYGSASLSTPSQPQPVDKPRSQSLCSGWTYLLALVVCVMSFVALFVLYGIEVVFLRGASGQIAVEANARSTFLIINTVCRGLPVMMTGMLMQTQGKSKWLHWSIFAFSAFFTLLMNNPVAIARFWFGAVLMGFCCLYIHVRKIRITGLWIAIALTLAGLTIFPLLSATRRATSADQLSDIKFSNDWTSNLTDADFDGYSMIIASIEWTHLEGSTGGRQLIGNSLFWLPRSIWGDKPIGSGQMVAEYFDMFNVNMAEPIMAEAYVNFGWLGIPLYAFGIARLFSAVDRRYWKKEQGQNVSVLNVVYPFLTALTIYFMRGDYLSGVSASLSLTVSSVFAIWLFPVTALRPPANS